MGIGGRIKRFFLGDKLDKERIKALGISPDLPYGMLPDTHTHLICIDHDA